MPYWVARVYICIEEADIIYWSYIFLTIYNLHCIASSILVLLSPRVLFVRNLFAMLSSPTPADQSPYHRVDYPTGMYSRRVRGNSRDVVCIGFILPEGKSKCKIMTLNSDSN